MTDNDNPRIYIPPPGSRPHGSDAFVMLGIVVIVIVLAVAVSAAIWWFHR
jgi:hypothetical protein